MVVGLAKRGSPHKRLHNLIMVWPALVSDTPGVFPASVWKPAMCATIAAVGPALFCAVDACKASTEAAKAAGAEMRSQHYPVANAAGEKLGNLWRCFDHEHHWIQRLGVTPNPDAESMIFQLLLLPPRHLYPVPGTPQFFRTPKPPVLQRVRSGRERWRTRAEIEHSPKVIDATDALPFAKREEHFGQATRLNEKRNRRMARSGPEPQVGSPADATPRPLSSSERREAQDGEALSVRTAANTRVKVNVPHTLSLSNLLGRRISETWVSSGSMSWPSSPVGGEGRPTSLILGASAPPSAALREIFASARSDAERARAEAMIEAGARAYDAAELAGADELGAAHAADVAMVAFRRSKFAERVVPMSAQDKTKRNIPVHRFTEAGRRRSLVRVVALETNDDLAYAVSKSIVVDAHHDLDDAAASDGHLANVQRERMRFDARAESTARERKASHERYVGSRVPASQAHLIGVSPGGSWRDGLRIEADDDPSRSLPAKRSRARVGDRRMKSFSTNTAPFTVDADGRMSPAGTLPTSRASGRAERGADSGEPTHASHEKTTPSASDESPLPSSTAAPLKRRASLFDLVKSGIRTSSGLTEARTRRDSEAKPTTLMLTFLRTKVRAHSCSSPLSASCPCTHSFFSIVLLSSFVVC
jgi:hypothetical protein